MGPATKFLTWHAHSTDDQMVEVNDAGFSRTLIDVWWGVEMDDAVDVMSAEAAIGVIDRSEMDQQLLATLEVRVAIQPLTKQPNFTR